VPWTATGWHPETGEVKRRGYEGYVAKDEASAYGGGATRRWLKVKQRDWTVEEDRWRRRISSGMARGGTLFVKGDDEKIRNLLLGLTGLLI
jgi:ATP-dependent DNA ligase